MSAAQYMADVFRRHGVVEPDRLSEALGQVDRGGTLLDALSRNGVDETPLSQALAQELDLPLTAIGRIEAGQGLAGPAEDGLDARPGQGGAQVPGRRAARRAPVVQQGLHGARAQAPQEGRAQLQLAGLLLHDAVAERAHVVEQEVGVGPQAAPRQGWLR